MAGGRVIRLGVRRMRIGGWGRRLGVAICGTWFLATLSGFTIRAGSFSFSSLVARILFFSCLTSSIIFNFSSHLLSYYLLVDSVSY
jgi:hypothetical protein